MIVTRMGHPCCFRGMPHPLVCHFHYGNQCSSAVITGAGRCSSPKRFLPWLCAQKNNPSLRGASFLRDLQKVRHPASERELDCRGNPVQITQNDFFRPAAGAVYAVLMKPGSSLPAYFRHGTQKTSRAGASPRQTGLGEALRRRMSVYRESCQRLIS